MQSLDQNRARELCFVWGAPLSGQRRWMLRSAELSKPNTHVTLCFSRPDESLESLLKRVEAEMAFEGSGLEGDSDSRHIYIEWPSKLLHQDFELEEWIAQNKSWSVSFAGIVSEDAHFLGDNYKQFYEEFARSTQSVVILGRSQDSKQELPQWIQNKDMDFGRHVSVFEDDLWPKTLLVGNRDLLEVLGQWTEEFEEIEFPIATLERLKVEIMLKHMLQGELGTLWGAEMIQLQTDMGANQSIIKAFTIASGKLYEWQTHTSARCVGLSGEVAHLTLAGIGLQKSNLLQNLRSLQLILDS